ncbi:MAG: hypothetical protein ABW164_09460 [Sphingobium sp.]
MRTDTTSLLQRLGQRDFRYREFYDAFADMELWPIFEALLADERVVGKPMSLLAKKEAALPVEEGRRAAAPPIVPPAPSPPQDAGLFTRYADPMPAPERPGEDLRGFLKNLSSRNQGG